MLQLIYSLWLHSTCCSFIGSRICNRQFDGHSTLDAASLTPSGRLFVLFVLFAFIQIGYLTRQDANVKFTYVPNIQLTYVHMYIYIYILRGIIYKQISICTSIYTYAYTRNYLHSHTAELYSWLDSP